MATPTLRAAVVPSFRMQLENGTYYIYLTRVDGKEVPVGEQLPVFSSRSLSKAQSVHDALNGTLLSSLGGATRVARAYFARAGR